MPRPPRMLLLTLVAVLAALPVIVTAFSPWAGATSVLVLSLLPVLGVARGGIRSMVLVSAAAAVTVQIEKLRRLGCQDGRLFRTRLDACFELNSKSVSKSI